MSGWEPFLAGAVLAAVAVALAVLAAGWVSYMLDASTTAEQLLIVPGTHINALSGTLRIHIVNRGGNATIEKVEVVGLGECTGASPTVIGAGESAVVTCNVRGAAPGRVYTVKVYTGSGRVYTEAAPAIA